MYSQSFALRRLCLSNKMSIPQLSRSVSTYLSGGKATLPSLEYGYQDLEPYISGQIMQLHHQKHHNTYVNGYNTAIEKIKAAEEGGDLVSQIQLQKAINFHGGGHINHSLFWKNLAPAKSGGGQFNPDSALGREIKTTFGSYDSFVSEFNTHLAGVQGSGWTWLVRNKGNGKLEIINKQNQDPVLAPYVPLLGVDAWEHAYYLQYENRKVEYFAAIWNVINWKEVEKRFETSA